MSVPDRCAGKPQQICLDLSSFVFSPRNCGFLPHGSPPHHTQITSLELLGCCRPQPPYKRPRQCKRVSNRSNWNAEFNLNWSAGVSPALCLCWKNSGPEARSPGSDSAELRGAHPPFGRGVTAVSCGEKRAGSGVTPHCRCGNPTTEGMDGACEKSCPARHGG